MNRLHPRNTRPIVYHFCDLNLRSVIYDIKYYFGKKQFRELWSRNVFSNFIILHSVSLNIIWPQVQIQRWVNHFTWMKTGLSLHWSLQAISSINYNFFCGTVDLQKVTFGGVVSGGNQLKFPKEQFLKIFHILNGRLYGYYQGSAVDLTWEQKGELEEWNPHSSL